MFVLTVLHREIAAQHIVQIFINMFCNDKVIGKNCVCQILKSDTYTDRGKYRTVEVIFGS